LTWFISNKLYFYPRALAICMFSMPEPWQVVCFLSWSLAREQKTHNSLDKNPIKYHKYQITNNGRFFLSHFYHDPYPFFIYFTLRTIMTHNFTFWHFVNTLSKIDISLWRRNHTTDRITTYGLRWNYHLSDIYRIKV
jgi:hypothetical protein